MIDPRAIELAKREGYRPHGNWQHMFCDPEFWDKLCEAITYEDCDGPCPSELAGECLNTLVDGSDLKVWWDTLLEPALKARGIPIEKPSELSAKRVRKLLRRRLSDDIYNSWFASLELKSMKAGVLIATVPVKFIAHWIQEHYADELLQVCAEEFENLERVEVVLRHPSVSRTN